MENNELRSSPSAEARVSSLLVALGGPDVRLGEVPAADVGRLLVNLDKVLTGAASVVVRRPAMGPGRREDTIKSAAHFRLRGIKPGSVLAELAPPAAPQTPDQFDVDVPHLGELAARTLIAGINDPDALHPAIAKPLAALLDEAGVGRTADSVSFILTDKAGTSLATGVANRELRRSLDRDETSVAERNSDVLGTLVEADFEHRTARLLLVDNSAVNVSFDDSLDDGIYTALRGQARLEGLVRYDPDTEQAKTIQLRALAPAQDLFDVDPRGFSRVRSFAELQSEQEVSGLVDSSELFDEDASEEERESYARIIAGLRG
jgi:hypothetical protein